MKRDVIIIGCRGKMSLELQNILKSKAVPFRLWPSSEKKLPDLNTSMGIIDFSTPENSNRICAAAQDAAVPYVCGTTGWDAVGLLDRDKIFSAAAKIIPVVVDSNFSRGIEVFCDLGEIIAKKINAAISLSDFHHDKKKDAPSGTALKIKDRILKASPNTQVEIQSIRLGEIPGDHRLMISFEDQILEVHHRSHSRRPFAEGAYASLLWAKDKKPGLYTMKDVLK